MIRSRGQSALYAIVLMPTLILILALAVDMAGLQMQKLRLRYAVGAQFLSPESHFRLG